MPLLIKKYIILSLVIFLFLQIVGAYYIEKIQHKYFKELVLSNKKHANLETITLSHNKFKSLLVIDNEIYLNNELYDIVNIEIDGEMVILSLYKDSDEKNSNIKIKNNHKKSRSSKGKNTTLTKSTLFCTTQSNFSLFAKESFSKEFLKFKRIKLKNIVLEIVVPPPEIIANFI